MQSVGCHKEKRLDQWTEFNNNLTPVKPWCSIKQLKPDLSKSLLIKFSENQDFLGTSDHP